MTARLKVKFDSEIVVFGETYYYRGVPLGHRKQIERSLKIKIGATQKEVLKAKKDFLDSIERLGTAGGRGSVHEIMSKYVAFRELEAKDPDTLSESSIKETRHLIKNHLAPHFGRMKIEQVDQKEFSDYCLIKRKKGLNLVNHRKVMSHFLKWCLNENYLKYRPELEIPKAAKKKRRERLVLTDEEVTSLISVSGPKLLLYVGCYLFMGMRNMEICKLRWDEIDFKNRALFVNKKSNRRRKARSIPINSFVFDVLAERLKTSQGEYVFPSSVKGSKFPFMSPEGGIAKAWSTAKTRAKITREITPHDLRATFETHMGSDATFTDVQREKMAGASIEVQNNTYIKMDADRLRGLEESVKIKGLEDLLKTRFDSVKSRGKSRGKRRE